MKLSTSNTLSESFSESYTEKMDKDRIEHIERQLETIKERNVKVEADKAWEGSAFRISTICVITYAIAAFVLCLIGAKRYWLDAFIPPIGFFISTQSLPIIKRWWIKTKYTKTE